ncbi:hypothetical protein T265_08292 [Opisthorchis viverrini]|uniref:Uncharacterized protein n=1 Tax=Opisthorchis viverrini TaxID=6198 RepID=A0A074ZKP4_OPIVI|nr:hypothetical protein T265_08292 [Opisthorchis viverrini]KER23930.1 hypothetical protein T265_08292 [Opisthorchis viverrini]
MIRSFERSAWDIVQHFTNRRRCINSDFSVTDEDDTCISETRVAFTNLKHPWRQREMSLNLKGPMCQAAVRAVLLCGRETRPLRAADLRQPLSQRHKYVEKKAFSRSTFSEPNCHATRRLHEGWDTVRLPKPRQGKSRSKSRIRTTDLPAVCYRIFDLAHLVSRLMGPDQMLGINYRHLSSVVVSPCQLPAMVITSRRHLQGWITIRVGAKILVYRNF